DKVPTTRTPTSSTSTATHATRRQTPVPRARPMVASTYTTAAAPDSRYATGACSRSRTICTPERNVAAIARTPYTATSTRPGPLDVLGALDAPGTVTAPPTA